MSLNINHAADLITPSSGVLNVIGTSLQFNGSPVGKHVLGASWSGAGSALTTSTDVVYVTAHTSGTITRVTLLTQGGSGSCVVDIWKDTYANYPPVVGDSITASAKPTISSTTKSQDTTLTGWTTSVSAGDILRFNVDSITTCTRVLVSLTITRTS